VLLHGLASTVRIFDDVIAHGGSRFRFVGVDLPRSGRSKQWARRARATSPTSCCRG